MRALALVFGLLLAVVGVPGPAPAAADPSLVHVTSFGSNPGHLAMYTYTPAGLPNRAPLVVALHGCSQSAADFYTHSGWRELADRYRFAVVFPQQSVANNTLSCFNWYDATKDARGRGEALSVKQMVDYERAHLGVDPTRVFVTGLSAGGAMTADLLADYPDVFAGGAVDSGIAAQCASSVVAAGGCQELDQHLSPTQWAAKVRAADPGYAGPWPRVAIWQGTADLVVNQVNARELRDQWTAVHGVSQTPTRTRSLTGGTTETTYGPGAPVVKMFLISGMPHGLAVDPGPGRTQCGSTGQYYLDRICSSYYTAKFWGIAR